jgi:hypothetical protein
MDPRWRKSSLSEGLDNCVELAHTGAEFGVRDSKNVSGPVLGLPIRSGLAFVTATAGRPRCVSSAKDGRLDPRLPSRFGCPEALRG